MAMTVDPTLITEIKRHGAFDISACFHCGNCTAVCPLSSTAGSFPRKMIRLGQLGDRERLLGAPEAWLCYYCGECSDTCPRQAEPGEYMAALRRYAIAGNEPTGVARLMYRGGMPMLAVWLAAAIIFGLFLLSVKTGHSPADWPFASISYQAVHNIGIGAMLVAILALAGGVAKLVGRMGSAYRARGERGRTPADALRATLLELATMRRHREDCETAAGVPWLMRSSWVHMGIMWGFLALLAATTLDFVFLTLLPLHLTTFWPARILGTVGGLALVLGVGVAICRRVRKLDRASSKTLPADAWLLGVLLFLGITGFWLELVVTLHSSNALNDVVMLLHAAVAMELVLLAGFTKLAHVIYRPIALYMHFLYTPGETTA